MASDYSLSDAFKAIEDDLIASMMRNIDHHRAEEDEQGINWTMWQSEQLKSLEEYKQSLEGYKEKFADINSQIDKLIRTANKTGSMEQEIEILEAIKQGFSATKVSSGLSAKFFSLNERKLEALITATVSDMEKAEYAILRKSEDAYRKVIYNAQVYANTGAGTYEKAVDMATKDMLSAGLTCVQYKNGAVHTLADYADMAIRTASKRAYLQGEGAMRQEWGIHTVIVNKRINPCPHCLPFCGKVFIDDVWSGGTKKDGDYPLLSTAIAAGLYHPRCKDAHTTYFPGISSEPDKTYSKKELKTIEKNEARETRQQYAQRQADKYGRLSKYSLDDENQQKYAAASERYEEAASSLDTGTSTTQGTLEELFDGSLETMERQLEDVSEELEEALETVENDLNSGKKHLQTVNKDGTMAVKDGLQYKFELDSKESEICQGVTETAVLLDSKGKVIFEATSGKAGIVHFTKEQLAMMKGRTLTHNHPSGSTLSPDDVDVLTVNGLKAIRATNPKRTYQLSAGSTASKEGFAKEYRKVATQNKDAYEEQLLLLKKQRKNREITIEEYRSGVQEINEIVSNLNSQWLKENAKDYGYRYSVIEKR